MTIYEEIKDAASEAERESHNKTYTLAEREYFAGKEAAFCEVLEMFDKRERPEAVDEHNEYYRAENVADFLPPERTK